MEGKATDFKCFSSASAKQFLTVLSNSCCALSDGHVGPLQWITNLAGKLWPGHMAARWDRKIPTLSNIYTLQEVIQTTVIPTLHDRLPTP